MGEWPTARAIKLRTAGDALIVAEGVETTIAGSMWLKSKDSALWAMGSAGAIGRLPVLPGAASLTILTDPDANRKGIDEANRCAERWRRARRKVIQRIPKKIGVDYNDLIKGGPA